jgi:hypothetical protein
MTGTQDVPARPLLQVVRGTPSVQELAALVAVLAARTSATAIEAQPPARPLWGRPVLRSPLTPGPGAWRASGLPR